MDTLAKAENARTAAHQEGQLNVLWLVDHLSHDGFLHGAARYYLNVVPRFKKGRVKVKLCVLRAEDPMTAIFERNNVNVSHLGRSKFDPRALTDVVSLAKQQHVHLIHAHGYGSANIARLAGIVCRIPVILHAHDEDRNYPWYQRAADAVLSPFTLRAVAVSESVGEACVNKRRVHRSKVSVLHNGIPLENYTAPDRAIIDREKESLGIPVGAPVVGTMGRLREEKGIRYLIEAVPAVLKRFPKARFVIVGDGPLRLGLEKLATDLGVAGSTLFTGFREDIPTMLSLMDVIVVPSLSEGFGLVAVEAMAMKRPVLASKAGGLTEIIEDGHNGLLVPPRGVSAIAGGITNLLDSDEYRSRLAEGGFHAVQKYALAAHVLHLEELYSQAVSAR